MLTHLIPQILLLTYKSSFFWIVDNSSSFATGDMPLQVTFPLSGLTMIGIALPE